MITDWIEIDNIRFNVTVTGITESATVLYSDNTGRTLSRGARMSLDPLGTFFNHKITVARKGNDVTGYDRLFDYITQPKYNGFHVKACHGQTTIEYDAYISSAEREVQRIDDNNKVVYWNEMTLSIVAMEAQVLP